MKAKYFILLVLVFNNFTATISSQDQVWSAEAETGILEGGADINDVCTNASGGEFVRLHSDAANGLTFEDINISEAGTYRLAIDYFYKGSQPLEVFVNGTSVGIFTFPFSIWCYEGNASVMEIGVDLQAGMNSLKFRPANGLNAPFLDKLSLYSVAPPEINLEVSRGRVEPGSEVILRARATDILADAAEVTIEVTGISPAQYTLDNEVLTINAGTSSAETNLRFSSESIPHGTDVLISISAISGIPGAGEHDAVAIRIASEPEKMYVSSSLGDDLYSGVDPETPWKTLEKVSNLMLFPGDSILFKSGDTFIGQLRISGSGDENANVYFGKYGEGELPEIDGAKPDGGAYTSAVLIENVDHITLQDLSVTNDRKVSRTGESDEDAYGIQVLNSGDRVMKGFHFRDLSIREIFPVTTEGVEFNQLQTAAIHFRSMRNEVAGKEKNISDVLVENCYITRTTKAGIWSRHNSASAGLGNDSINRNMNMVFRNNHFFETGGSGIILSRSYNCLLENNIFEYTGSNVDPRMTARGSGAWFWNCRHILAQYNKSMHVRGPNDSYGMHIDFANEHVFLQYNYSEDSEGGFVEILGDNYNSVYRFNVSVNDGFRDKKGNSIWVSDYAGGGGNNVKSDGNYIYNNTIYVDSDITPDIVITGVNTYIYNNIFYATGDAIIGQTMDLNTAPAGSLNVSHNLFSGSVTTQFKNLDAAPVEGDPMFDDPGALNIDGYSLIEGSIAMNAGLSFSEPVFPQAGKGIFKDIPALPETDLFGNPVAIANTAPHIGAYAGSPSGVLSTMVPGSDLRATLAPGGHAVRVSWNAADAGKKNLTLTDLLGRIYFMETIDSMAGNNNLLIPLGHADFTGIAILKMEDESSRTAIKLPLF